MGLKHPKRTANRRSDGVVAGLGIEPNLDLAKMAGLQTADGIVVDERLRTSQPDIYAAGDVASFYNPALDRRLRVEHEDNANTMGRLAGRNMAGSAEPYHHLPFFYSDLFELGYEAVGKLDSRLSITGRLERAASRRRRLLSSKRGGCEGVLLVECVGSSGRRARADRGQATPIAPRTSAKNCPKQPSWNGPLTQARRRSEGRMGAQVEDDPLPVKDAYIVIGRGILDRFGFDKAPLHRFCASRAALREGESAWKLQRDWQLRLERVMGIEPT